MMRNACAERVEKVGGRNAERAERLLRGGRLVCLTITPDPPVTISAQVEHAAAKRGLVAASVSKASLHQVMVGSLSEYAIALRGLVAMSVSRASLHVKMVGSMAVSACCWRAGRITRRGGSRDRRKECRAETKLCATVELCSSQMEVLCRGAVGGRVVNGGNGRSGNG